jgi:hypothetical protein
MRGEATTINIPPRLIARVWLAVYDDGREELLPEHPGNGIYAAHCFLFERADGSRYLETSVDTRIYVETGDFVRLRGNWRRRHVYPTGVQHSREMGKLTWPA